MTRLQELFVGHGKRPWLDNLTRGHLAARALHHRVARPNAFVETPATPEGINGVSSFHQSFRGVLRSLDSRARQLASH